MQPTTLRPCATRRDQTSALRAAFSLVELVVVILIIAILASLILTGVGTAMTAARVAGVTVELKNIEKALQEFKAKYGSYPPSGVTLYEAPAGWAGDPRSRALIRQIWPDFSFTIYRDINGDGDYLDPMNDTPSDVITLNGAECLVFFLGGVSETNVVRRDGTGAGPAANTPVTSWQLLGFATNPTNPFLRGGTRVSFFEFDAGRLANRDGPLDAEGMLEYRDSLPGQAVNNPILYGSAYEGKGYRDVDFQLSAQAAYDRYTTARSGFAWYYRRYTASNAPASVTEFSSAEAFNSKTFQLISPGIDGEYGLGGVLNASMEMGEALKGDPLPATSPLYNNMARTFERDNITNFKGGTLN